MGEHGDEAAVSDPGRPIPREEQKVNLELRTTSSRVRVILGAGPGGNGRPRSAPRSAALRFAFVRLLPFRSFQTPPAA